MRLRKLVLVSLAVISFAVTNAFAETGKPEAAAAGTQAKQPAATQTSAKAGSETIKGTIAAAKTDAAGKATEVKIKTASGEQIDVANNPQELELIKQIGKQVEVGGTVASNAQGKSITVQTVKTIQ